MKYSAVKYSEIDLGNRIDAEYFQPTYLHIEKMLLQHESKLLSSYCSITASAFYPAATHLYEFGELPFIRCVDCISYPIVTSGQNNFFKKIPLKFANDYKNIKRLQNGEIAITKVGTPCFASIIHGLDDVALSRTVLGLKYIKNIDPYYLVAFLRSKYGYLQLFRERELTIQFQLTLERVGNVLIYKPANKKLEEVVSNCLNLYGKTNEKSGTLFAEAEDMLLSELSFTDWQPKHQLTFVKNYSDTKQSNRIDAEYYQPKYEEIEKSIKNYSGGCSFIKDEFKQNKSVFKINVEKKYQYVEIGSVNVSNGEITPCEVIGAELPANAKRALNKGDVIVSKVRTYRGAIAIVRKNGYVGSGAFTVLREDGRMNKETLLTFLHSKPLLAWSLKPNTGTSYPVIIDDDILSLPIPLLSKETQTQIQQKIIESFDLRKQSRHLLECAKRAVEIAIENDEQTAIKWLEAETKEIQM